MTTGFSNEPLLRSKQQALDVQDLRGAWHIHYRIWGWAFSSVYTRIDQIFMLWGVLAIMVFCLAQALHMSWQQQSIVWSGLTVVGVVSMIAMVRFWASVERLMWLVYSWAGLMLAGIAITNWGVFGYVSPVLLNLCPLWLWLCAIGHGLTGWGIRSRTFLGLTVLHAVAALHITQLAGLQYGLTGLLIGGSLLLLTQLQWDMRPPIDYAVLGDQERAFNQQQAWQRQ